MSTQKLIAAMSAHTSTRAGKLALLWIAHTASDSGECLTRDEALAEFCDLHETDVPAVLDELDWHSHLTYCGDRHRRSIQLHI